MMNEYHRVESCNKCRGFNKLSRESYDSGHLHEASTKCVDCGFEDYWAFGYFESGAEMESKCEKYYTNKLEADQ